MQSQDELEACLQIGVDQIARDFIGAYGLKYEEETTHLSEPLLRWLDFTHRYIPPTPRKIYRSDKFPMALDADAEKALLHIEGLFQSGGDINPYQSKGLILHNDVSSAKKQWRTDLLWADWGIHHVHLSDTPVPQGSYFSDRSKWLLFCMVASDGVLLIDVRDHSEVDLFAKQDLAETIIRNWPEIMEPFRFKGILMPATSHTAAELTLLRKSGVMSILNVNGNGYMDPNLGITTASTPGRLTFAMDRIKAIVQDIAKFVFDPGNQFKQEAAAAGIADPDFDIGLTAQGVTIIEKRQNKGYALGRAPTGGTRSAFNELHDLLAPAWAVAYIVRKSV